MTKNDRVTNALYKALAAWIELNGGEVAVVGGIEIQKWPGDRDLCFRVAVRCAGRPPGR